MAKEQRFEVIYSQGKLSTTEILVDKETGVQYLFHQCGYAGGLTPLIDHRKVKTISAWWHAGNVWHETCYSRII